MPGLLGTRYRTQDFVHGRQAFYRVKLTAQEPGPLLVWRMLPWTAQLTECSKKVLRTVSGTEYVTVSQWQPPCLPMLQNYYFFILIERHFIFIVKKKSSNFYRHSLDKHTHSTMLNPVPRKARVTVWYIWLTKIMYTWFHRKRDYTIRAYLEICFISYYILVTLPCYHIDSYLILFPRLCHCVLVYRHHLTNTLLTDIWTVSISNSISIQENLLLMSWHKCTGTSVGSIPRSQRV